MLRVWGRVNSINVQKVMWAVGELGLEHERVDAGGAFGGLDTEEYAARNPNRKVPCIDDDGFVLWESNAIVRYLARKHGGLMPDALQQQALAEQWMDWASTTPHPDITVVFWGLIRTPPDKRDMAAIEAARVRLEQPFTLLDRHLAGRAYVVGEALSAADIALGCFAYRWYALPIERPQLTNLRAYYERLAERPAFQQHVMIPLT